LLNSVRKDGGNLKKPCGKSSAKSALLATGIDYVNLRKRSDLDRGTTRQKVAGAVTTAFRAVFPAAAGDCSFQETSSGMNVFFPPSIPDSDLLAEFLPGLERELEQLNRCCSSSAVFRLRAVFHSGEESTSTISAAAGRLLGSNFLRLFLAALPNERSLALLVSDEFYRRAIRPGTGSKSEFRRARIRSQAKNPVTVWAYRYPQVKA